MATYHLRRYFLDSEDAAVAYLTIWRAHITSLVALNITTVGFFTIEENPREVVALLRFAESDDPVQAIRAYMASPGFAQDMAGFDMAQINRVEVQTLWPGTGSQLN